MVTENVNNNSAKDKMAEGTPWLIKVVRAAIDLRVLNLLSDDEYLILTVIGEAQDRRFENRPVNLSQDLMCRRMAISPESPRRIRNAVKSLESRNILRCTRPALGTQRPTEYWIDLAYLSALNTRKTECQGTGQDGPSTDQMGVVTVTPEQATRSQDDRGGVVTVTPREWSQRPLGSGHGDPSLTPVFITPEIVTPESITPDAPLIPPEGGNESDFGIDDSEILVLDATPKKPADGKRSSKADAVESVVIPLTLNTDEFLTVWGEWIQHRKEIRKPLTRTQAGKQLKQLDDWGLSRAIAAVEHSITKGWQGIFEPASNGKPDIFAGIREFAASHGVKESLIATPWQLEHYSPMTGVPPASEEPPGWKPTPRRSQVVESSDVPF